MTLYRTTLTLTFDSELPDREAAIKNADEIFSEIENSVLRYERVVKTAALIRKRRTNGELHD